MESASAEHRANSMPGSLSPAATMATFSARTRDGASACAQGIEQSQAPQSAEFSYLRRISMTGSILESPITSKLSGPMVEMRLFKTGY
jgi:hypothetical protein